VAVQGHREHRQLRPFQLTITTLEKPFNFQLKQPITEARYNDLWLQIEKKEWENSMKKQIAIAIAAAALMFAAPPKQTFTGVITDSMCSNADHRSMNMGADAQCVTACVKAGAKYVLYDGKQAYTLSDQKTRRSSPPRR